MAPLVPAEDFPILARTIEGKRLVYLDSAATALKPQSVVQEIVGFYERMCANIHRGNHLLSQEASEKFESARDTVAQFIGATGREIVFTANATAGINLVAQGIGLKPDDNVISSIVDHHSNLLPWMSRSQLRLLPETPGGLVDVQALERMIDKQTRMVALHHVSNVTGALAPIEQAIEIAHRHGVPVLIDGSQSVPHFSVDVRALDVDYLVFSAHKMLGPSGVGVLFIREAMWDRVNAAMIGGGTVDHVRTDGFNLKHVPYRFEAGTPNIEGVLGLAAAIRYLSRIGMDRVREHDLQLTTLLHERLLGSRHVQMLGPTDPKQKVAIASLVLSRHPVDASLLGMMLSDTYKVMARAGTHCAHPYFKTKGTGGSLRLSAYIYNTEEDINVACDAIETILNRVAKR